MIHISTDLFSIELQYVIIKLFKANSAFNLS